MKKINIIILFLFFVSCINAQVTAGELVGIHNVTTAEMNAIVTPLAGSLVYNTTDSNLYIYDGTTWKSSALNWALTGNSGLDPLINFLGNTDDVKMQIRSNNWPMLEFGRRATLGLVAALPDYTESDQPLLYVRGDNATSALQFAASGAGLYKPMFFTTDNGSFRLKGSSGGTDLFEIGSAGPGNDGSLEFVIGDDGTEPIIFKRYDYRSGRFHTEFFRVQGSDGTVNSKTRFGININPQRVVIDPSYNGGQGSFNMANSTLQVSGSVSKSIITTSGNLLLSQDHHTIILGGNHAITLPAASTREGRIYVIKNPSAVATVISSYLNEQGASATIVNSGTILRVQSDGSNWQQIANVTLPSSSTGKTLLSVDTTPATANVSYTPPTDLTLFRRVNTVLPQTTIVVQVGDIVDVRVNISEDFGSYNDIGDILRFYVTNPALIGSPTMTETLIIGGDNKREVASGALSQMFTVTQAGTLIIGLEIKFVDTTSRNFSTSDSGVGALQAIIYR